MPEPIDLTGRRFARLTVLAYAGRRKIGTQQKRFWRCRCDCGNVVERNGNALKTGGTRSCGCLLTETITKHGAYRTAVYGVWHAMLDRCRCQTNPAYKDYGGRGITVCERWLEFTNFRDDMGPRPTASTLERNDVNGNYEPVNCRWATPLEQANNRRNNRRITHDGRNMTVTQWAKEAGVTANCILHRLAGGWSVERALTSPSDRSGSNVETRRILRA